MEREIIDISPDNLEILNDLHGNERYAVRYVCESCKTLIEHDVKDGSYIVTRNFYPSKINSYRALKCESCAKSSKKDPYFDKPGCNKNWPLEVERDPTIFQTFQSQNRNRVWIKFNCSNCDKVVVTEYDVWAYTKNPAIMNKFQCRACNCEDTKKPYYDSLAERDRLYEESFEHTDDGYKIIHDVEEMKRLATNGEKIAFYCEDPECEYHTKIFKMELAKKCRINDYIKFGQLLCESCRFKRNYDFNHANEERRKTFQENWGTDHPMKDDQFKKDYYDNLEEKYGPGVKSTLTVPEVKAKSNEIKLERYGTIYPSQNPKVAKKISEANLNKTLEEKERILNDRIDTNREQYGVKWYPQSDDFKIKTAESFIKHYGVSNYLLSDEYKTYMMETFGTLRPQGFVNFYGMMFDSSWELAIWIYCIDHKISIIRMPYTIPFVGPDGKSHIYEPDFMINGKLIEVKGDHWFDSNGTMRYPYSKKKINDEWVDFTPEEKAYWDNLTELKHQCGLANGVEFWKKEDCKKYIDYCDSFYPNWNNIYRKDNPYNPSYWCFNIYNPGYPQPQYFIPINLDNPITPFDKPDKDGYIMPKGKGVSPWDIGLERIHHD